MASPALVQALCVREKRTGREPRRLFPKSKAPFPLASPPAPQAEFAREWALGFEERGGSWERAANVEGFLEGGVVE